MLHWSEIALTPHSKAVLALVSLLAQMADDILLLF